MWLYSAIIFSLYSRVLVQHLVAVILHNMNLLAAVVQLPCSPSLPVQTVSVRGWFRCQGVMGSIDLLRRRECPLLHIRPEKKSVGRLPSTDTPNPGSASFATSSDLPSQLL